MTITPDVPKILRNAGALLEGHFLLASGRHSSQYLEKFRVLQHPADTAALCRMMADHYRGQDIQAVTGPTLGGVILAYEVARELGVRAIYAERGESDTEARVFRRDFEGLQPGEKTLVVDDILTTGGSVQQVIDLVRRTGAEVSGVAVLVDRSNGAVKFDAPFYACHVMNIPTYQTGDCPMCSAGSAPVKPGSS